MAKTTPGAATEGERTVNRNRRDPSNTTTVAGEPAVQPLISGSAWITRYSEVVLDPTDPFQAGSRVADIW